jgi:hypothetical protein
MRPLPTILILLFCQAALAERVAGLVASYATSQSQVVLLPELGLVAEESMFFEGMLTVEAAGHYAFYSAGQLWLDGRRVTGEIALDAGAHVLRLSYDGVAGPVSVGLAWESEHFIMEPVPPRLLWHEKAVTALGESRIQSAFKALNCVDCHEPNFLATMHHKFRPDALLRLMRHTGPPKWYGKPTGPMPPESEALRQLAADLRGLPRPERSRGETATDLGKALSMVGTKAGFACITCHDIKHHRSEAESKGPNLSLMAQRVSYDWFVRWMRNPQRMKPGVAMPAFFTAESPELQQQSIDTLWDYLAQGDTMQVPDELRVDPQQFVLKPSTKPMVQRVYIRLPNGRELLRAICVGLPNGMSYCFDAETCQLAYAWTGGYLDMAPHWKNQSGSPTPAVGEPFFLPSAEQGLRIGEQPPVFRGYELLAGIPRFEFSFGDTAVQVVIDAPTPGQLRQSYTIGARAEPVQVLGVPERMRASMGDWTENRLTISETRNLAFTLTIETDKTP